MKTLRLQEGVEWLEQDCINKKKEKKEETEKKRWGGRRREKIRTGRREKKRRRKQEIKTPLILSYCLRFSRSSCFI
jgi:hypothetical protein